jgi:hypothetical protein
VVAEDGATGLPDATSLLITADSGGSNSARSRPWKWGLQRFANRTGLMIVVCHFPPRTSKWNKIEYRLLSFNTQNCRGRPLTSLATIISLIGSTRTQTELWVRAELHPRRYPKGRKVPDEEIARLDIQSESFHGEWNYVIRPRLSTAV